MICSTQFMYSLYSRLERPGEKIYMIWKRKAVNHVLVCWSRWGRVPEEEDNPAMACDPSSRGRLIIGYDHVHMPSGYVSNPLHALGFVWFDPAHQHCSYPLWLKAPVKIQCTRARSI